MPKVLIADKLSPAAVAIFKERGVEADVKTGLSKEELLKIVDQYDGIAIRSATKVTADVIKAAKNLKVVGRDGRRRDRDEHAVRQLDHHGGARDLADAGAGARTAGGERVDAGGQVGKE